MNLETAVYRFQRFWVSYHLRKRYLGKTIEEIDSIKIAAITSIVQARFLSILVEKNNAQFTVEEPDPRTYHGCLTGDCPHEKESECFEALQGTGIPHEEVIKLIKRLPDHEIRNEKNI